MNNKKVIVVTWYGTIATGSNYGTSLQSYALQKKLADLGYDAIILPERQESDLVTLKVRPEYYIWLLANCNPFVLLRQLVQKVCHLLRNTAQGENGNDKLHPERLKFQDWDNKHYKVARCSSRKEWIGYIKSALCYIAGSDQIWNTHNHYNPFWFLGFTKGKKISYASSIGARTINPRFRKKVVKHLMRYSHISVREKNAGEELSKLTGRHDIVHVFDPTLLLSKDDWIKVADEVPLEIDLPSSYVLCYLLSHDLKYCDQVRSVAKAYGIEKIVIISSVENPEFDMEGSIRYGYATPSEFVALIRDATVVCTDSFHGTIFSVLFEKQFVEFKRFEDADPKSQNSRIYELLEMFGLYSRLYDEDLKKWSERIDYKPIIDKIEEGRDASLRYLVNAIET